MWSQVLAFVVGAGVALLTQALGQTLTTRRERRADLARAVDRVVSSFADGERTLDDLTDAVQKAGDDEPTAFEQPLPAVEHALADAERNRVEMRAALFSLRVRAEPDSPLFRSFDEAFREWEIGFLKCKIIVRENEPLWGDDLREARGYAGRFRGEFYDVALEHAAEGVGRA